MRLTRADANRQPARVDSTLRPPPVVPSVESSVAKSEWYSLRWWLLVVSLPALALLYWFDPTSHGFYPRCQFRALTGLDCPGCGGLRATHALLHGDLASAWQLNALYVSMLPIGVIAFLGVAPAWLRAFGRRWGLTALLVAGVAFTVWLNL